MTVSEIIQVVCAIASLIVAFLFFIAEKRQNNRIEKRDDLHYKQDVEAQARAFVLKYSCAQNEYQGDIYLLPLCVMAKAYKPLYPYSRLIYQEFNRMSTDVQEQILRLEKININVPSSDNFYDFAIVKLKEIIRSMYPNDKDIFYENGKYLERALINHGNKNVPDIFCESDAYNNKASAVIGQKPYNMSFRSHITNLLAYEKDKCPIKRLCSTETNLGKPDLDDEIIMSYLCCIIAEYVPTYTESAVNYYDKSDGNVDDYCGNLRMEDLFLKALLSIAMYCDNFNEYATGMISNRRIIGVDE